MGSDSKILLGCLIVVFVLSGLSIEVALIRLGWNYVIVDTLALADQKLTWVAAIVATLALNVVGGLFRSTSHG